MWWLLLYTVCWWYRYVCHKENAAGMCVKLNNDLQEIYEWLRCNNLSVDILWFYDFHIKSKTAEYLDINISETVERVYDTKFLGVYIDAQLTWKRSVKYTCSKLSKCAGIFLEQERSLTKALLYYYIIYLHIHILLIATILGQHIPLKFIKNSFGAEKIGSCHYLFSLSYPYRTTDVSQPIIIYT